MPDYPAERREVTDVFTFTAGNSPLLISIPHDGRQLAPGQARTMSPAALRLPDTDWHVGQLYALATTGLDVSIITANYSRYVVDLNRPANDATMYDGKHSTGICPTLTFAGEEIYLAADTIHAELKSARIARYWRPYHEKIRITLAELRERHGYALLWDAHSIASQVPLLFEGRLPDLNVGTDDGRSAAQPLADAVTQLAARSPYSTILNGRFRGGHITRHYGDPGRDVHALQLELVQQNYMDEESFAFDARCAESLAKDINAMLKALLDAAATTIKSA